MTQAITSTASACGTAHRRVASTASAEQSPWPPPVEDRRRDCLPVAMHACDGQSRSSCGGCRECRTAPAGVIRLGRSWRAAGRCRSVGAWYGYEDLPPVAGFMCRVPCRPPRSRGKSRWVSSGPRDDGAVVTQRLARRGPRRVRQRAQGGGATRKDSRASRLEKAPDAEIQDLAGVNSVVGLRSSRRRPSATCSTVGRSAVHPQSWVANRGRGTERGGGEKNARICAPG